ncbi:hypothetical protein [Aeromicrobium sp. CnD17-E]|uniref:variant leucine-rich repeat-containing protein n=1 Tax=Aeromicrobium sp. CnD17-E TaxID=2954487 RepID=UPI002097E5F0|nr:hypothetical protein [Aeromicrobium sp. CnD17-E]MCO7240072.1 hypothetical protein [Aeromicrobium sp. CnD17-E]
MTNDDLQREAADPHTSAARLHEIAQADREVWPLIAAHPHAYDGLLEWLGEHGDDTVREAIAARAAAVPPPPPPPQPPGPPAPPAPPTQESPVQEAPVEEPPVAEPTVRLEPTPNPTEVAPAAAAAPAPAAQPTTPTQTTPTPVALESDGTGSDGTGRSEGAGSGGTSVARVLLVLGVIAALVAGGYFGIRALTGDDDSSSSVASSAAGKSDDKGSDDSGDASGSGDSEEFCSVMKDLRDSSLSSLDNLNSQGGTPDLDALRKQLDETAAKYEALRKAAPAEIADDVKVLADLMSSSASASSSGGTSPFADFSSKEYLDASTKVSQYYYTHCSS